MRAIDTARPLRVMFLIRQLEIGGAERQLLTLVRGLPRELCEPTVVSMYHSGGLAEEFNRVPGLRVVSLDKRGRYDVFDFARRLQRIIRDVRPDVLHGYMYGANEIALLAGLTAGLPVVWGIRVSAMDFQRYNRWTHWVFRAGLAVSPWVDLAISNSESGLLDHRRLGLRAKQHLVIPNGIDTSRFRRDEAAAAKWRSQLGISADELVVSMIGRFDPMKDHETFFRVVAKARERGLSARFICVGEGTPEQTARVHAAGAAAGVAGGIIFVAPTANPIALYSGSSIVISTSAFGEGFPNVIGEAMACQVPCVSTATGDAAVVLGDPRWIAAPGDADALTEKLTALSLKSPAEREALGCELRERIEMRFGTKQLIDRTLSSLNAVSRSGRPSR